MDSGRGCFGALSTLLKARALCPKPRVLGVPTCPVEAAPSCLSALPNLLLSFPLPTSCQAQGLSPMPLPDQEEEPEGQKHIHGAERVEDQEPNSCFSSTTPQDSFQGFNAPSPLPGKDKLLRGPSHPRRPPSFTMSQSFPFLV